MIYIKYSSKHNNSSPIDLQIIVITCLIWCMTCSGRFHYMCGHLNPSSCFFLSMHLSILRMRRRTALVAQLFVFSAELSAQTSGKLWHPFPKRPLGLVLGELANLPTNNDLQACEFFFLTYCLSEDYREDIEIKLNFRVDLRFKYLVVKVEVGDSQMLSLSWPKSSAFWKGGSNNREMGVFITTTPKAQLWRPRRKAASKIVLKLPINIMGRWT